MSHPADPPTPIPEHLWPWAGPSEGSPPLAGDDLCMVLTPAELAQISRVALRVQDATNLRIVHREGSPWIELDVVSIPGGMERAAKPWPPAPAERAALMDAALHRFALWRYTLKVYVIRPDGAVGDDPIDLEEDR
jgi:hypothetical protein